MATRLSELRGIADEILGDGPVGDSSANTDRYIGLGQRAAEMTQSSMEGISRSIQREAEISSRERELLREQEQRDTQQRDLATWVAAIQAETSETPSLDYYQGLDIDSNEDTVNDQAARIVDSANATFEAPKNAGLMSKTEYNYEGLPEYMQPESAFRTALAEVEADTYDTMFGNAQIKDTPFKGTKVTSMTMDEIFDLVELEGEWHQYNLDRDNKKDTTAIGKYQMVGATLRDLRDNGHLERLGITGDTLFNQQTQDAIAMHLAERRVKPNYSMAKARKELRNEWAGFKKLTDAELNTIINEIRGA